MCDLWLIGAGSMAKDYDKALKGLGCNFTVIGRGEKSALNFTENTGTKVITGGLESVIAQSSEVPQFAIVATGVDVLASNCKALINAGVKNVLVEKPAGVNIEEITEVYNLSQKYNTKVYVAYNRRFFASVLKAKEIIAEDSGVSSFNFEFTEWAHIIENLKKGEGVLDNWFLANSTHVVDLAFFLGGKPQEISTYTSGSLEWHSRSSNFAGAGISKTGALFSYCANWEAPGRWAVEILTSAHRLYLKPMEKLDIQKKGSIAVEPVKIDDKLDIEYKPGLYRQVSAFLNSDETHLCSLDEHVENLSIYDNIAGY